MRKTFKKYPRYTDDHCFFLYYISSDGTDMTGISRTEFLEHVHSTPHPDNHVYIDREGGMAIFFVDTSSVDNLLTFSRRDFNREAKHQERAHQCVMEGTNQCDGWKPDGNGCIACDACMRQHTARTISLNAPVGNDNENEPIFMDYPSEEDATARLFDEADKAMVQDALDTLSDTDREYLLARCQPGMTARKLAEEYGITDYRYANRKAHRILDRVIKHIQEIEK